MESYAFVDNWRNFSLAVASYIVQYASAEPISPQVWLHLSATNPPTYSQGVLNTGRLRLFKAVDSVKGIEDSEGRGGAGLVRRGEGGDLSGGVEVEEAIEG